MVSGMALAPYFSVKTLLIRKSVGKKRQCKAPQWIPVPPTPSPGRKAPKRRIGNASSSGALRKVMVSVELSCISSSRTTWRSSSCSRVNVKSSATLRSAPRSSPTTLRPAFVNSRARIAPEKPMPITIASMSFNRVAIAASSSRKVCDRLRLGHVTSVAVVIDLVGVGGGQAGEADQFPGDLVTIAAIDRIGEEAGHGDREQLPEEGARVETLELGLATLHRFERRNTIRGGKPIEILAVVSLARPRIGRRNPRREIFTRRQRQLIALLRFALPKWTRAIHFGATAPGAAELPVDEDGDTAIAARGREFVGWDQRVDGRDDERRLQRGQRDERLRLLWRNRRRGRRRRRLLGLERFGDSGRNRGSCDAGAEQEFATRKTIVSHCSLPLSSARETGSTADHAPADGMYAAHCKRSGPSARPNAARLLRYLRVEGMG